MHKNIVPIKWLKNNLQDPKLILLDASPEQNKSGLESVYHGISIPKARIFNIKKDFSDRKADMPNTLPSPSDFEQAVKNIGINKDSIIIVFDNLGIYTSARVWWMFQAMGHKNISVLDGGIPAWVEDGNSTSPIRSINYPKGNFLAKPISSLKRDMGDILKNLESQEALLLDARSNGRFCGTAPEPRVGLQSGHIPHAMSLPWTAVIDQGKMKSAEELKVIFNQYEIGNRDIIFSCGSGLTACIIMLAASVVLINKSSIYDGSWTEWAQKQPRHIETKQV